MSAYAHEKLLNPALMPSLLQAIKNAAFPDNAMAPARIPPTDEQVHETRRECARTIVDATPAPARIRYFATKDEEIMRIDVEETLELFGDSYVNKNLIVAVLELIVVRLFPELAGGSSSA